MSWRKHIPLSLFLFAFILLAPRLSLGAGQRDTLTSGLDRQDTAHFSPDDCNSDYWRVRADNGCETDNDAGIFTITSHGSPHILLVDDDDNNPDVRAYYTGALDALGLLYTVWDTENTDNEPDAATLADYSTVIWFTGDEFGGSAGPGSSAETDLANWLDAGNCLFISSQDYYYDRGLTSFMGDYLGVSSAADDNGDYTSVTGTGSLFGGLGTYTLSYPFTDYSDTIVPDGTAELAFQGNNSNGAAVNKEEGGFRTTYWTFPFEALSTAIERETVMETIIDWCFVGRLQGTVTDGNTGQGIAGATLTVEDGANQWTTTTNATGAYSQTVPVGIYDLTATAPNYVSATATVVPVTVDQITVRDFTLESARLNYAPTTLEATVALSTTVTRTVTISNEGSVPLDWRLTFVETGTPASGSFAIPASDGNFPRGHAAPSPEMAPVTTGNQNFAPYADLQTTLSHLAAPAYGVELLGDEFVSFDTDTPGTLNTIVATSRDFYGADFLGRDFTTLYAVDNGSDTLYAIDTATGVETAIGPMVSSGTQTWTGLAADRTTGNMYAMSTDCSTNTLYTVDVTTAMTTTIGTASGVCIIDIAVSATGAMYGLDILADELLSIDKATGNATTVGSLGFDANFAQGMDFDEELNVLYLAAYNNAVGAAELRIADTTTGATILVGPIGAGSGVEIDAFAIAPTPPAWVYAQPLTGTVPAGDKMHIDVIFDATAVSQTGTYSAEGHFFGNFPNDVGPVSAIMHVSNSDVELYPPADATDGYPGSTVAYTLRVTNTGRFSETYNLALSENAWPSALSDSSVTLNPGESTTVEVTVAIPDDSSGQEDTVTVTATSLSTPPATDSAELTTTSESAIIYAPVVLKR